LKGLTSDGSIGDILLSADGQKINDMDDLFRLLDKKQIGDTVSFEIYRSGKTVSVPVKLLPSSANSGTPTRRGIQ
jgi:S1-C subfamily serine protease